MSNYEMIKECKIIYEYINDMLTNAELEINKEQQKSLKQVSKVLENLYDKSYSTMLKNNDERKQLETNLNCPHCSSNVMLSDVISYAYVCNECDENFYLCEGDLNYEWYYDQNRYSNITNKKANKRIYKVSKDILNEYIYNYQNGIENINYNLLYCEDNNKFIAIDNCSRECFVEEFDTEEKAVLWLSTDLTIDELSDNIMKTDIIKNEIDMTYSK